MSDPPAIRVSDAERDRTVGILRDHAAAGRLTLEEFADRAGRALEARTADELQPLTRDLPASEAAPVRKQRRWHVMPIGGIQRRGRWRVPDRLTMVGVIGGADLDLTGAELTGDEATIDAFWAIGGIELTVPDGIDVEVSGFTLIGGVDDQGRRQLLPGSPRIRVRQFGLIGGLSIRRRRGHR